MKLLITLIFSVFCFKSNSQTNEVQYVHFHTNNSIVINSDIDIYIYEVDDKNSEVVIKTYDKKKEYLISNIKLSELSDSILKINVRHIMQDIGSCLDGGDIEIEFSARSILPQNFVKYKASCLSQEDKKTVRKDFLNTVNLILEIAKLKFDDLR